MHILLSDLMKIGVRYIHCDYWNTIMFNDGTVMYSRYNTCVSESGTDFSGNDFYCFREGKIVNIIDDVGYTISNRSFDGPRARSKQSGWYNCFSADDVERCKREQ